MKTNKSYATEFIGENGDSLFCSPNFEEALYKLSANKLFYLYPQEKGMELFFQKHTNWIDGNYPYGVFADLFKNVCDARFIKSVIDYEVPFPGIPTDNCSSWYDTRHKIQYVETNDGFVYGYMATAYGVIHVTGRFVTEVHEIIDNIWGENKQLPDYARRAHIEVSRFMNIQKSIRHYRDASFEVNHGFVKVS